MKNITLFFFLLAFCLFHSSCVEEEDTISETEEETIAVIDKVAYAPAIIFSYNVVEVETYKTTSWFIDDKGNVRKMEHTPSSIYHQPILSFHDLNRIKNESIKSTSSVNMEELVDNYEQLKLVEPVPHSSETESREITIIYGYFFEDGISSCSCGKPKKDDSEYFKYRLLQQKAGDVIEVSTGDDILAWINSLNLEVL